LPAYRGASAINWPIILGEKETGLSIFWPDNASNRRRAAAEEDADRAQGHLGHGLLRSPVPDGRRCHAGIGRSGEGRQSAAHQADDAKPPTKAAPRPTSPASTGAIVAPDRSLVRGCNPAPGAGRRSTARPCRSSTSSPARPRPKGIGGKYGEVVEVSADGFTVVCPDGRIKVLRVKPADGPKVGAGEWAAAAKLAVGARLV